MKLNKDQVFTFARRAGFDHDEAVIATQIAYAESRWETTAINDKNTNGSIDYGLMQINSVHKDILSMGDWKDPVVNMRMAKRVYDERKGNKWAAWSTYNNGSYKTAPVDNITPHGLAAVDAVVDTVKATASIPDAVAGFGGTLQRIASNIVAVIVAMVLLVLGVVLLMRESVTKAPVVGNIAKVAKAVA